MKAFWGLMKKDFVILRFLYGVFLICVLIGMFISLVAAEKLNDPTLLIPVYIMALSLLILLMPLLMYGVLRIEGRTQMWLYNPQNIYKIVLSKLSIVFIMQVIAQILFLIYGVIILKEINQANIFSQESLDLWIESFLGYHFYILLATVSLSLWVLLFWSIYHSLGKYPRIRYFRNLIIILIWLALWGIEGILNKLIKTKLDVFTISLEIDPVPKIQYVHEKGWEVIGNSFHLPFYSFFIYVPVCLLLLFLSCWLLERKVEV